MDFWRQLDIFSPDDALTRVTVIGAGGIGSPTVLALAKMGVGQITVYDDDFVELHNLPNQLYRFDDLDKPKVAALAANVEAFTGIRIEARNERFVDQPLSGIVVSAVDSMAVRQAIWERVRHNPWVQLYIEARMGAEVGRVHTVVPHNPDHIAWYETTLYDDDQASEEACTARAIIYNVFGIASFIGSQVKKFSRDEDYAREIIFDFKTLTLLV